MYIFIHDPHTSIVLITSLEEHQEQNKNHEAPNYTISPLPHYFISHKSKQPSQHFAFQYQQSSITARDQVPSTHALSYVENILYTNQSFPFIFSGKWHLSRSTFPHSQRPTHMQDMSHIYQKKKLLPSFWTKSASETTFCSAFSLFFSTDNFSPFASFSEWVKFVAVSVTQAWKCLSMFLYFYIPHILFKSTICRLAPMH